MIYRALKNKFKRLQYGPLRILVALAATMQQSIKFLSFVHVYTDKDGDWHNSRRDVTFVSPNLNVASYDAVAKSVKDLWCYNYLPRPGDVIVDVGAGIGDDAVAFSRMVGDTGLVIAIEAHPDTFRCLQKTVEANCLKNVIPVNIAAFDQEIDLYISNGGDYLANSISSISKGIKVRGCSLDNFLKEANRPSPNFIKMNIEGAETAALRGMRETLSAASHLVISCHDFIADNHGGDPCLRTSREVTQTLQNSGFQIMRRVADGREEIPFYLYGKKSNH